MVVDRGGERRFVLLVEHIRPLISFTLGEHNVFTCRSFPKSCPTIAIVYRGRGGAPDLGLEAAEHYRKDACDHRPRRRRIRVRTELISRTAHILYGT